MRSNLLGMSSIDRDEAKRLAQHELRFEIGNLPHLTSPEYDSESGGYRFNIMFTKTDIPEIPEKDPQEYMPEDGGDIEFYESQKIGELFVTDAGEIERTSDAELSENIQEIHTKAEQGELPKREQ